jgi:uncharacterized membrane protein YjgN (DUF898 family)
MLFATLDGEVAHRFRFTGVWTEYAHIWYVNLALSILTLGIYSAWAKVRTKRYFYGHTGFAGSRFEFHGRALAILRGRLLTGGMLIGFFVLLQLAPAWAGGALIGFLLILPWLIVKAARFRAHNSSWRGIRFHFAGPMAGAYARYLAPIAIVALCFWMIALTALSPFVMLALVLSCYCLYPFLVASQKHYLVRNHRLGTSAMTLKAKGSTLFGVYFAALFLFAAANAIAGKMEGFSEGLIENISMWVMSFGGPEWTAYLSLIIASPVLLLLSAPTLFALGFLRGQSFIWQWDGSSIAGKQFKCDLQPFDLAVRYFVNTIALALSLGLLAPWAMIKTAQLKADSLKLMAPKDFPESLENSVSAASNAVGDEAADLLGLDIGI